MFNFKGVFICLAILLNQSYGNWDLAENPNLQIVNGTNASMGEFPYVVSLRTIEFEDMEFHTCGGSIIGNRWILTAGHCLDDNITLVRAGQIDVGEGTSNHTYSYPVLKTFLHPDYLPTDSPTNDIALIELSIPLNFSDLIQPLQLPASTTSEIPFGKSATLAGWGAVNNDRPVLPSQFLQKVELTLFSESYCDEHVTGGFASEMEICAGVSDDRKGQCNGDSGGPLVVNGTQWGIVSWSVKPCASQPGVFTKIPVYREWIRNITGI